MKIFNFEEDFSKLSKEHKTDLIDLVYSVLAYDCYKPIEYPILPIETPKFDTNINIFDKCSFITCNIPNNKIIKLVIDNLE